jgi:hypothetical protein
LALQSDYYFIKRSGSSGGAQKDANLGMVSRAGYRSVAKDRIPVIVIRITIFRVGCEPNIDAPYRVRSLTDGMVTEMIHRDSSNHYGKL